MRGLPRGPSGPWLGSGGSRVSSDETRKAFGGPSQGADPSVLRPPFGLTPPPPPPGSRDEVAILRDAASGEPGAVRVLLDVHLPTVYGFVRARLGGGNPSVDDVMQETLEEAIRSAHTFRGESALATWLCAIARRRLARHYERERRAEEAGRWAPPTHEPAEEILDRKDEVVRALGKLPPSQREVLVLKYMDDLSVERVAVEIGKTTVQVQSLLQRGRDGLKKELDRVRS